MENIGKLVEAVLAVMEECQGIDKGTVVGSGNNKYKGVSDKDVKLKVGASMRKHGLIIVPTKIESLGVQKTERDETYQGETKTKRSYFTEVLTSYKLIHKEGGSVDLAGYGHGVDNQDKGAGKATTYALKYTLLYTFLVATGYIDDADSAHSDEASEKPSKKEKITQEKFNGFVTRAKEKSTEEIMAQVEKMLDGYEVSKEIKAQIDSFILQLK